MNIFETLRADNGKIFKLNAHLERLFCSAKAVGIEISSKERFSNMIKRGMKKSGIKDAYIRLSIDKDGKPSLIIKKLPLYPAKLYKEGVDIATSVVRRGFQHSPADRIKSGDFLPGVIAKAEAKNPFELIMLSPQGYVTEGTISNIFILKDKILWTPPTYLGILNGITRESVIENSKMHGIEVKEIPFTRYELYNADSAFLTNTTMGIMPVKSIDGKTINHPSTHLVCHTRCVDGEQKRRGVC